MRRVLVVGGGSAGLAAAAAAKESGGDVVLLEEGPAIGGRKSLLPYLLSGEVTERDIRPADPERLAGELGIGVRVGEPVTAIETATGTLKTSKSRYRYECLVLATGSRTEGEKLPGGSKKGVFTMKGAEDYLQLAGSLQDLTRVAILGSTLISFLVAELIARSGVKVALFVPSGSPIGLLVPSAADILERAGEARGVETISSGIEAAVGVDHVEAVISNGLVYPCDGVVTFPHVFPRVPQSPLTLGRHGGILVDRGMKTSASAVYAAGDCAEIAWGGSSFSVRLDSSSKAMGTVAGTNAGGGRALARISGVVSQTIFGVEVCGAGIGAEQARALGIDPVEVTSSSMGRDAAFGTDEITCTLVFDRSTLAVCGASLVGWRASSHAEAVSLIVAFGMGLRDLAYFDAAYSPKNSAGVSPIALTARKASAMIGGSR